MISATMFPGDDDIRANVFVLNMTAVISDSADLVNILESYFPKKLSDDALLVIEEIGIPKKCFILGDVPSCDYRQPEYIYTAVEAPKKFPVLTRDIPNLTYWTCPFYSYVNDVTEYLDIDFTPYMDQMITNQSEETTFFHNPSMISVKFPKGKLIESIQHPEAKFRLDSSRDLVHVEVPVQI